MKLTDRKIKLIKGNGKDQSISDGNGLYLRVHPSGYKEWRYRYKKNNTPKWVSLGIYPSLSLAEARLNAHKQKAIRLKGDDPNDIKQDQLKAKAEDIAKRKARITIKELCKLWLQRDVSNRKDKGAEVIRCIEKDVIPAIGAIPAEEVTKSHIATIIDSCLARGSDRMAKVVLSLVRQMFRFAQDRDIVQIDPTASIRENKVGKPDIERDRVLSEIEIKELTKKIEDANLNEATKLAIWIALGTGCRIGELIKTKWEDIDLKTKTWLIIPENSKNGKSLTVHLSKFSLKNFTKLKQIQLKSVWVYPNRKNSNHLNTKTITKQIGDRQLGDDRKLKNRSKNTMALILKGGKWTPHDLRRTSATLMTALGVLPDIADRCLNHVEQNKLRRTYMQYSYSREKKDAWDLLGDRLELLTVLDGNHIVSPQTVFNA
jgi:integrase